MSVIPLKKSLVTTARFAVVILFITLSASSCAGGGQSRQTAQDQADSSTASPAYFTGDGGRGMSLAVLAPESEGLGESLSYLPAVVQGCLVSNISKYSAISVRDRVSLDRVIAETLDPIYREDEVDIIRLGHIAQVGNIMTGKILRTSTGYTLQINVTETSSGGATVASYSDTCTVGELDDQSAIHKASRELLTRMGVQLTAAAVDELGRASTQQSVAAQTALARGITAQRQGTEVAALSYYFQAAAFDPALAEAANRASVMSANISSGNIGEDVRNDIQWRRDWIARLTETERYFDTFNRTESMPYTLFYSDAITQGDINYQNETVTLSIQTNLHGTNMWAQSVGRALRAVYNGLNATGRKEAWGLDRWPAQGVTNLNPFARQAKTFTVIAELLNNRGQVIGRQTFQARGWWQVNLNERPIMVGVSPDVPQTVAFTNVKADDITGSLTIRIASVNGTNAETVARNGVLQIKAIPKDEFDLYSQIEFVFGEVKEYTGEQNPIVVPKTIWAEPVVSVANKLRRRVRHTVTEKEVRYNRLGEITHYTGNYTNIAIPSEINGVRITKIGDSAFYSDRLTSVIIPVGVTSIGNWAFAKNQLISVTIPAGVTSIGRGAFDDNQLKSVTIPASVASIGDWAFWNNQLTSITIGASVSINDEYVFQYGFHSFYNQNGKKAGVYTYTNGRWNYSSR